MPPVVGSAAATAQPHPDGQFDQSAFAPALGSVGKPGLPMSLGLGGLLVDQAGYSGPRILQAVGEDEPTAYLPAGRGRAGPLARPAAMLVMGDGGSTCRASTSSDTSSPSGRRKTASRSPPTSPSDDWYPLFPNPVVAESLLDRLINTSHQVFMNGPSYRPSKRPGRAIPTGTTSNNENKNTARTWGIT